MIVYFVYTQGLVEEFSNFDNILCLCYTVTSAEWKCGTAIFTEWRK